MQDERLAIESPPEGWQWRWTVPASLLLHVLPAAILVLGLHFSLPQPPKEQTISVKLVPPPKNEKAEGSKRASPPPREAKQPDKLPRPETKTPSPKGADAAQAQPTPVLRPVLRFGDKDAGPRASLSGNGPHDGGASPDVPDDRPKQTQAAPPKKPDAGEPPAQEEATAPPAPNSTVLSAAGIADNRATAAEPAKTEAKADARTPPPEPAPRPDEAGKVKKNLKLREAETLFSPTATGDPAAMTAIGRLPRDVRVGELCVTELRQQLLNAQPPYIPEILPSYRLKQGTVLEIRNAAFRSFGRWFDLSYRCEVDADALKVVSFAFRVGDPIPRSEWQARHLPMQ